MVTAAKTQQELLNELRTLRQRLEEAEETLRAIRAGEVDALVVNASEGEQIFTLLGADHPYRLMVEHMTEGALTVNRDGTIVYCNEAFARMLGSAHARVVGANLASLIAEDDFPAYTALIEIDEPNKAEIRLRRPEGKLIPTLISTSAPSVDNAMSMIVTDLTEHKHNQELMLSQKLSDALREQSELARNRITQILESITDAFVAFDSEWRFTAVNQQAANNLFRRPREEVIGRTFDELYPDSIDTLFYRECERAKNEKIDVHFEAASRLAAGSWFEVHAYPDADGLWVYLRDITERKKAEQQRELLLEQEQSLRAVAETANRVKDEFLATVSHELRTPLNAILGWVTLIRHGRTDPETINRAIDVVERNARAQARLIEDLLDVSRMMSGNLRLNIKEVDLNGVISEAVEAIQPVREAKSIRLELSLEAPISIQGDANRIQQVVGNLLSNAVKFTPEGGTVEVRLTSADSKAQVVVTDSGVGVDPQFLPHMFEPFQQGDRTTTRRESGLGLGLAIARRLVEMHGGTISANSEGRGRGATFTLTLPRQQEKASTEV